MSQFRKFLLLLLALPSFASACEICAVFNSVESTTGREGEIQAGIAYQYQFSDSPSTPPGRPFLPRQSVTTHTTQVIGRYYATDDLSLQLNLPIIYRDYDRFEDGRITDGTKSGIGDITLLGKYQVARTYADDWAYQAEVFTGLKLPTGDSDPLVEEVELEQAEQNERSQFPILRHGAAETGVLVGGDDLTLGSGSVDIPFGAGLFVSYKRTHLLLNAQYNLRTEGRRGYQFGNDVQWQLSIGHFINLEHDYSVAPRLRFSGEVKGKDDVNGSKLDYSDEANLFLGPELAVTLTDMFVATFNFEFAVKNDDSSQEIVSQQRALASILWNF